MGSQNGLKTGSNTVAALTTYQFGPYRLEVSTRRLFHGDELIPLTPKAFDVLVALIERRERVVDKGELMKIVWPESFVEEANLSQTVFVLRKTLGEAPDGNQYIETVPRRGYRFAGEVRIPEPAEVVTPTHRKRRRTRTYWAIAASVIVLLAIIAAYRASRPETTPIRSLAVLPLQNLSGDAAEQYFVDGLTEALISDLAQVQALRVVARSSTNRYRNTTEPAAEIGKTLGVEGIITGSVVRSGGRVRVSIQLVDPATEQNIWARSYERQLADVLDLQREVARAVTDEIRAVVTPAERLRLDRTTTIDARAHDAYLKGRFEFNRRTRDGFIAALAHFENAIAIEPRYAEAFAGIADCHTGLSGFLHAAPLDAMPRALEAATKALELNPDLAEAHASQGYNVFRFRLDWPAAEQSFRRAIALNPSLESARQWHGISLAWTGRFAEARTEMDRALLIDPLSLVTQTFSAWLHYLAREYDAAVKAFDRTLAIDPSYVVAHRRKGWALQMLGRHDEAIASFERARQLSRGDFIETAALGRGYAMAGRRAEMLAIVKELQDRDPRGDHTAYSIGEIYAAAGDAANAVRWLERAYEKRSIWFVFLKTEPVFDRIRSAPRFQELIDRVKW
jgi:TolB-like protein/DNA-binding winged helix-turn-helix (wHTH) protein/Flp pilus assembly protein TadD